ncbi:MAG: hypothetical protein RL538_143 [Candidatus Parcubacteria bacterium]
MYKQNSPQSRSVRTALRADTLSFPSLDEREERNFVRSQVLVPVRDSEWSEFLLSVIAAELREPHRFSVLDVDTHHEVIVDHERTFAKLQNLFWRQYLFFGPKRTSQASAFVIAALLHLEVVVSPPRPSRLRKTLSHVDHTEHVADMYSLHISVLLHVVAYHSQIVFLFAFDKFTREKEVRKG